jgi:hypothetical protein
MLAKDCSWPVNDLPRGLPTGHCPRPPQLGLLGDLERGVDVDPEVTDGAFALGVAEQKLDRSEILGGPIDQRRLGSARGRRPTGSSAFLLGVSRLQRPGSTGRGAGPPRESVSLHSRSRQHQLAGKPLVATSRLATSKGLAAEWVTTVDVGCTVGVNRPARTGTACASRQVSLSAAGGSAASVE